MKKAAAFHLARLFIIGSIIAGAWAAPVRAGIPQSFDASGTIRSVTGRPLSGATVRAGDVAAETNESGDFSLRLPAGTHVLTASHPLAESAERQIEVSGDVTNINFSLKPVHLLNAEVVVSAIRAGEEMPVTTSDLDRSDMRRLSFGQEMPFLLKETPSVTQYSDAGSATGYSYFTIRGIGQTRINMTLDGVPLNDPEDSALYFSNFGDFTNAVDSVQIQRGVGASTVGSASFGGSINFASVEPREHPHVSADLGLGSFGTRRGAVALHSGLIGGGFALYGRASVATTDGFREHSGADQKTIYYGATRQDSNSFLRLSGFSGRTRTQLAFLAADVDTLRTDIRYNPLTTDERDDFGQDFLQVHYTRALGQRMTLGGQGFYSGAQGWFRIWDTGRTALQQYGINGRAVGSTITASYRRGRFDATWGAFFSDFSRDHFMSIVGGPQEYTNTGYKKEANTFLKLSLWKGPLELYSDSQVRWAKFRYSGSMNLGSVDWTFFNPKLGVRWQKSPGVALYGSAGYSTREPTRSDMLAGEDNATLPYDLHAVKPEHVIDFELGTDWNWRTLSARAVAYAMEFRHEIALTGELSEIGLPTRRNVGSSYRRGFELEARWRATDRLSLRNTTNLSRNRIRQWTQYYDIYDTSGTWLGSEGRVHTNVAPLLTPGVIMNQSIDWLPRRWLGLSAAVRYVSRSQLDNTGQPDFRLPSYLNLDAGFAIELERFAKIGRPRLRVQATNLLNRREYGSGYSYLAFERNDQGRETLLGTSYYYPLALRGVSVSLEVSR
jgi:iron complex outermembrane receptor protein